MAILLMARYIYATRVALARILSAMEIYLDMILFLATSSNILIPQMDS